MNHNFKRTFDSVKMSSKRQEEIKSKLSFCLAERCQDDYFAHEKATFFRRYRIRLITVIALLSLSLVGFTYGNQIINLLGGGHIEQGKDEKGNRFIAIDTGFVSDPVLIEDGQIYFVLDGSKTNITARCSDANYFKYEKTNNFGYRNVVIIGGTSDNIGMAEFVWDENGQFVGSNASHPKEEEPQWLTTAKSELLIN